MNGVAPAQELLREGVLGAAARRGRKKGVLEVGSWWKEGTAGGMEPPDSLSSELW